MCLQDQRMVQGGTFEQQTSTPAAGSFKLPDMSRALWFSVIDDNGGSVQVYYRKAGDVAFQIPRDTRMTAGSAVSPYYSRDQCGSLFYGPLTIAADGVAVYTITWFNMDAETYGLITHQRG